jgi:hypothetical protein
MPINSDLFSYLTHAHMFTDLGLNPLTTAPLAHASESLVRVYPTFYANYPSAYGPAWVLLSAPGTLGPHDVATGLVFLKSVAVLAFLGCAWLVERILIQIRPTAAVEGLYLFTWNPLVLLLAVGDGHNDMAMMALVLLSFWLLLRERWGLAFAALALSVWIKFVSVVFLPMFAIYIWRGLGAWGMQRRKGLGWALLALLTVSLLVWVPFWDPTWVPTAVERMLHPLNWRADPAGLATWAITAGLAVFAVAYGILVYRFAEGQSSFHDLANTACTVSLLAIVVLAARSQPWHLIWPLSLAGLSDRRWSWPVVAVLAFVLLAGQVWVQWGAPGMGILS